MATISRITTTYSESEDRLRLAGADAAGQATVVLWLTQRLTNRLVRALTQWLEDESGGGEGNRSLPAELRQSWAQEAALRQRVPSVPVRVVQDAPATLVESVDLARDEQRYTIGFRRGETVATLKLASVELRQWLGIVRSLYQAADWSLAEWPAWMDETPAAQQLPALLH